jgi:hypothetical protein
MPAESSASPHVKKDGRWVPALLVGASGLVACVLWTLPTWKVFWSVVIPHLAQLWRVPANRHLILLLALKVGAPLPIMTLTGLSLWLVSLLWSFVEQEADTSQTAQNGPPELVPTSAGMLVQLSPRQEAAPPPFLDDPAEPPSVIPVSLPRQEGEPQPKARIKEAPAQAPGAEPEMKAESAGEEVATTTAAPPTEPDAKAESAGEEVANGHGPAASMTSAPQPSLQGEPRLELTLLGKVALTLVVPGVGTWPILVKPKGLHLLAFLAVRRSEAVARDKILYHLFEWGTSLEEETGEADHFRSLVMAFERQKKFVRKATRKVVALAQAEMGAPLPGAQLDPLLCESNERWRLAPCCHVVDIEEVEAQNAVIEQARKEGLLTPGVIPARVKDACECLLTAYKGDFLAGLIEDIPQDFQPWEGKASWARRYNTHYRDLYLKALWISGEYEQQEAQRGAAQRVAPGVPATEQRERYARAIARFRRYAEEACKARFDEKVSYDPANRLFGERIVESERALRRCLSLCTLVGDTHEAGEVYAAYARQMTTLLRGWHQTWQPSAETQRELERVGGQTGAHRFAVPLLMEKREEQPTHTAPHDKERKENP